MIDVYIKRLHSQARLPMKSQGDVDCCDLWAYTVDNDSSGWVVHTGISIALPQGYNMLIHPWPELSFKCGLTLLNTSAIVSSTHRSEILLRFNRGYAHMQDNIVNVLLTHGPVAQALILKVPEVNFIEAHTLPDIPHSV